MQIARPHYIHVHVVMTSHLLTSPQDALNPDAEAGALHRYRQARTRLLSDLKDQLLTRTENIDEDQALLEYSRERTEILTLEAKVGLAISLLVCLSVCLFVCLFLYKYVLACH